MIYMYVQPAPLFLLQHPRVNGALEMLALELCTGHAAGKCVSLLGLNCAKIGLQHVH